MDFPFFTEDEQPTMGNFNEKLKQAVKLSLDQAAKIEVGSYQGTDTGGENAPNSLTFSFVPKLVIMPFWMIATTGSNLEIGAVFRAYSDSSTDNLWLVDTSVLTTNYKKGIGFGRQTNSSYPVYGKKSSNGKTLSWYSSYPSNPGMEQNNARLYRYCYIAIG